MSRARGKEHPVFIRDAIESFCLSLEASRASPSTVVLYRKSLSYIAAYAEAQRPPRTRIDQLTLEVVRGAMRAEMLPGRHPPNWKGGEGAAKAMGNAIRAFGKAMRVAGVACPDWAQIAVPALPERIQVHLQPAEFTAIEGAILRRLLQGRTSRFVVARDLAIVNLLADTGLRAAECCALTVADLDLKEGAISVRRGKGSKPRVLSLWDADGDDREGGATLRVLRDYLAYRAQSFGTRRRELWLTVKGEPLRPSTLRKALAGICAEAGLDGNRPPHAFRRGYFSDTYREQPTALPVLSARMGWSPKSRNMIETYTRGANINFARDTPVSSNARRWRQQSLSRPADGTVLSPFERKGRNGTADRPESRHQ